MIIECPCQAVVLQMCFWKNASLRFGACITQFVCAGIVAGFYLTVLLDAVSAQSVKSVTHAESKPGASIVGPQQKCARDAAFQILTQAGISTSLEAVDRHLSYRQEASVQELVDVLEKYDLSVQAFWLDKPSTRSIRAMTNHPDHVGVIAVLPPRKAGVWHFANVVNVADHSIKLIDASDSEVREFSLFNLREDEKLGLLFVQREELHNLPLAMLVQRSLSSTRLGLALAGVFLGVLIAGKLRSLLRSRKHWSADLLMNRVRRLSPSIFAAIGLVGVAAAVGIASRIATEASVDSGLAFSEAKVQAGALLLATEHNIPLTVENPTEEKVVVTGSNTSCGCLSVEPDTFTLRPGEQRKLVATVKPAFEGEQSQFVTLLTQNKDEAATCEILYLGRRPARLDPVKWNVGTFRASSGIIGRKKLTIRDYYGEGLDGVQVEALGEVPVLRASLIGEPVFRRDGELEIELRTTENLHRGIFTQKILVSFEDIPPEDFSLLVNVTGEVVN